MTDRHTQHGHNQSKDLPGISSTTRSVVNPRASVRFLYPSRNEAHFTNPAGIDCLANTAHTHCTYAKPVLVLGAFARCSAVNSLKSFQIMCLLYSDKLLSYSFCQVLSGHLVITTSKIQEVTEWGRQRGEEKAPMHVLEGVEAKRKLEPISV